MSAPILPAVSGPAPVSDCSTIPGAKASAPVGEEGESASFDSLLSGEEPENPELATEEENSLVPPDPSLLMVPLPWMQVPPPPTQPLSFEGEDTPEAIGDFADCTDSDYSGEDPTVETPVMNSRHPFAFHQQPAGPHAPLHPQLASARALTAASQAPAVPVETSLFESPVDAAPVEDHDLADPLPTNSLTAPVTDSTDASWPAAPKPVLPSQEKITAMLPTVQATVAPVTSETAKISQEVSAAEPVAVSSANLLRPTVSPRKPDHNKAFKASEEVGTATAKGQNSMTQTVTNSSIEETARPVSRGQGSPNQWLGRDGENRGSTDLTSVSQLGGNTTLDRNLVTRTEHTSTANRVADTTPVFQAIHEASEKLKITGTNRVEIDVKLGGDEAVKVRLEMRDGQLHTTFQTNSAELREKLQQGWADFSLQSLDRGMKVANANFESFSSGKDHQNQNNNGFSFSQNMQGQSRRETGETSSEGFHLPGSGRKVGSNGTSAVSAPTSRPSQTGDAASGLSVWA